VEGGFHSPPPRPEADSATPGGLEWSARDKPGARAVEAGLFDADGQPLPLSDYLSARALRTPPPLSDASPPGNNAHRVIIREIRIRPRHFPAEDTSPLFYRVRAPKNGRWGTLEMLRCGSTDPIKRRKSNHTHALPMAMHMHMFGCCILFMCIGTCEMRTRLRCIHEYRDKGMSHVLFQ